MWYIWNAIKASTSVKGIQRESMGVSKVSKVFKEGLNADWRNVWEYFKSITIYPLIIIIMYHFEVVFSQICLSGGWNSIYEWYLFIYLSGGNELHSLFLISIILKAVAKLFQAQTSFQTSYWVASLCWEYLICLIIIIKLVTAEKKSSRVGGWLDQLGIKPTQPRLSWGLGWAWKYNWYGCECCTASTAACANQKWHVKNATSKLLFG